MAEACELCGMGAEEELGGVSLCTPCADRCREAAGEAVVVWESLK